MPEPAITERENMERIADLARSLGWKIKHDRPGMTVRGHRTAVTYDGQGWPDLFMIHPASGDCLARELKTWARRKELGPGQADWIIWLDLAGVDTFGRDEPERDQPPGVWTERDWSDIIVPRLMRHTRATIRPARGFVTLDYSGGMSEASMTATSIPPTIRTT